MFKFSNALIRSSKNNAIAFNNVIRLNFISSATTKAEAKKVDTIIESEAEKLEDKLLTKKSFTDKPFTEKPFADKSLTDKPIRKENYTSSRNLRNNIVAAAFASLQNESVILNTGVQTPFTDSKISSATTVDELLSISEGSGISRRHALKVVSVLAEWSSTGKIRMNEFESDPRFLKLCKVLTKTTGYIKPHKFETKSEDLSTIMSVTADDEAAKLVASISLSQMIKVMSLLSQKKRRSTLLLRSLAYNITKSQEKLDLKQSADLLYSMAVLNFPDVNLLERVKTDVCISIEGSIKKSAVIGSILTSLGLLKYKDAGLLDTLTLWVLNNHTICRSQDIIALFQTLAVLNYEPHNFDQLYKQVSQHLTQSEIGKPSLWLELVWSLVVLNKATVEQISSVLSDEFLSMIKSDSVGLSSTLKLLNIDGASSYFVENYQGPRLGKDLKTLEIRKSKDKEELIKVVFETLKNLIPSETHLQKNVNTGMGFCIDALCILDQKCNPVAIDKAGNEHVKVAVMVYDYHDMCKGDVDVSGINAFALRLLEAQGYKVISIPYTEFKVQDKLVHRVKYMENKLKRIIES